MRFFLWFSLPILFALFPWTSEENEQASHSLGVELLSPPMTLDPFPIDLNANNRLALARRNLAKENYQRYQFRIFPWVLLLFSLSLILFFEFIRRYGRLLFVKEEKVEPIPIEEMFKKLDSISQILQKPVPAFQGMIDLTYDYLHSLRPTLFTRSLTSQELLNRLKGELRDEEKYRDWEMILNTTDKVKFGRYPLQKDEFQEVTNKLKNSLFSYQKQIEINNLKSL